MESICTLLGENATDWKAIRGVIIRDNFISTIVNFDADDISDYVREQMKVMYFFSLPYYFKSYCMNSIIISVEEFQRWWGNNCKATLF